jgi:Mg2+/Co2+ transporter CorC
MWCIACATARSFLKQLLPYIRSDHKKLQVSQALELDAELRAESRKIILKVLEDNRNKRWHKAA